LRRELGAGRPDLGRGYDDGGLIDLNTAPAALIAEVCGIDLTHAEKIVAGREARGGTFFNIGEVLVEVPLPPHVQDQLRERGIF
jgi:DNA uptake protein ComE-like DNA-binding protein